LLICFSVEAQLTGGQITTTKCQVWNADHQITQTTAITGEDGFQPITYQWQRSQNSSFTTFDVVGASTTNLNDQADLTGTWYYRRRVENNGSTAFSNTVTIVMMPSATITGGTTVCLNASNPTLTITATGGTAPYDVRYTIGSTTVDVTTNSSGTYTISAPTNSSGTFTYTLTRITDANSSGESCPNTSFSTGTATVTVRPLPTATVSTNATSVCRNGTQPVITFTGSNGTSGTNYTFTYKIDNATQPTVSTTGGASTTTVNRSTSTAGTFVYELISVQEGSAQACSNTQTGSVTVVVNNNPTITGIDPVSPKVCRGSSGFDITFNTTNSPNQYRIIWNTAAQAAGFTNTGDQTFNNTTGKITVAVPSAANAGTYTGTLRLTNTNTTCFVENSASLQVMAPPAVDAITSSGNAVCVGSTLALSNNTSGGTWSVNNSNATISTSGILTGSAVGSTTVSYTVTNSDNCTTTVTAVRTINALPNVQPISGNAAVCVGSSITLGNATTGGTWSVNNFNATINTSGVLTGSSAGTTTVSYTVTDANNCTATVTAVKTINALPTVAAISGANGVCVGANTSLTNATTGGVWSVNNSNASISSSGVLTGNASGTTTVTYTFTNNNGCTASITSTKTIFAQPVLQITNPAGICSPGTIDLTQASIIAGSAAGLQYSYWSDAAATIAVTSPRLIGSAGTYYIRGTEAVNNCSVIKPVTVAVLPQASMVINTPAAVCSPNTVDITNAAITSGSASGLSFTYFTDALGTQPLNTPTAVSQSGTYYIKGTPAVGCSAVTPVTVTIHPLPSLVVNSPAAVCAPGVINLTRPEITAGSSSDLRFNYFIDAAQSGEVGDATQIARSGTYYIRATNNQTGCRNNASVAVTVHPIPTGQLQTPAVNFICENGSLTLSANGATGYQWIKDQQPISGATNATYTATAGGTYTVRFISAQGCTRQATENITLEVLTKPVIDFAIGDACVGVQTSFQNRSTATSSGGLNWLWEFGDGSASNEFSTRYTYLNPGVYRVKLTASNPNCAVAETKTVEYIVRAAARPVRYPDVETLPGVTVTVKARNNIGNIYTWTPNSGLTAPTASTTSVTVNETTLYQVSIISDIGCTTTDTVLVKVLPGVDIYVPQGFSPNNDGQNDRLYPMLVGMRQLNYFKVFNRWGNAIFSTGNASASAGWDGMYLGQLQTSGAYTWVAEAIDLQGRVVRKTGTVLLLR
jgi:gliding motility-associated-like protein